MTPGLGHLSPGFGPNLHHLAPPLPKKRHPGPEVPDYKPGIIGQKLAFVGTLTNGDDFNQYAFLALAGAGAPTITAGFAKWVVIGRPQRVGMTVLEGYDPYVLDVPVLFDAVAQDGDVERDVAILEWMAGRGKLYTKHGHVGVSGQGDSPIVHVFSTNGAGGQTPLVPPNVQGDDASQFDWVITGIAYDTSPMRDTAGHRVRQAATVTLTQHVPSPGTSFDSPSVRQRQRNALKHKYVKFKTTLAVNTYKKIAVHYGNQTHQAAVDIMNVPANKHNHNPRVRQRSITTALPIGVEISVPKIISGGLGN